MSDQNNTTHAQQYADALTALRIAHENRDTLTGSWWAAVVVQLEAEPLSSGR